MAESDVGIHLRCKEGGYETYFEGERYLGATEGAGRGELAGGGGPGGRRGLEAPIVVQDIVFWSARGSLLRTMSKAQPLASEVPDLLC